MAKSRSFFGLRRGSTKSFTFSILGGQQITKDRVSEVRNPRSYAQQFQRAKFASMVKFFKQLPSGLLTYAYEDKQPTESYYNAFMRHNANTICTYLASQNADSGILAAGEVIIADGTLGDVMLKRATSSENGYDFVSNIRSSSDTMNTVADLSNALIAAGYKAGDIVNCVVQMSTVQVEGTAPFFSVLTEAERYNLIFSCYVDALDNTTILSHIKATDASLNELLSFAVVDGQLTVRVQVVSDVKNLNAALIISRRTSSGVKVTTSNMTCPEVFPLERMRFDAYAPIPSRPGVAPATNWTELVAQSYEGKEGDAILQGGLVTEGEEPLEIVSTGQPVPTSIGLLASITFNRATDVAELAERGLGLVSSQGTFTLKADGAFYAGSTLVVHEGVMSADGKKFTFGSVVGAHSSDTITAVEFAQ